MTLKSRAYEKIRVEDELQSPEIQCKSAISVLLI